MTQALALPSFKNIAFGAAGLVLALCCFFAQVPQARASSPLPGDYKYANGLSETQVGALLNLMTVFGADDATVNNVSNILRNNSGTPVTASGEPGATIATDPTYSTTGGFWLSGKAWNTNRLMVSIAPQSYAGATDQQTMSNFDKGGGTAGFNFQDVFVSGDHWAAQFGDRFGRGTFTARVYDDSSCNYATCYTGRLLTTGTVIISTQASASMLSVSPASGPAPLTVTFNTSASSADGALSIDFGDGYSSWFEKGTTRTYRAGSYVAKLYQCTGVGGACDHSAVIGTVTIVSTAATTSAMAPSASTVAVAPTCPPLHKGVTSISARNGEGSCSVSTTTAVQQVAQAPQEALAAAVPMASQTGVPDVAGLLAAAVVAPWQAAVDSFSQILYAIGAY